MGKGLEDSLSPAVSAESYPPNRYANHIKPKPKQSTKLDVLCARPRRDSMAATMRSELGQSESQRFFATFAEKEEKKMTLLKLTT